MPALSNARYEAFAVARFKGATIDQAYERAGYKRNRGNAARLNANDDILKRVAELHAEAAKKATDHVSFDAADMFRRLEHDIAAAQAAGDHKAAMQGRSLMIEAFGYKDSPTLTHEHVRGQKLDKAEEAAVEAERPMQAAIIRFPKTIAAMRKRVGG